MSGARTYAQINLSHLIVLFQICNLPFQHDASGPPVRWLFEALPVAIAYAGDSVNSL
jgi:hypothetical protein